MTVNPHNCPQNHRCPAVSVCPAGAITQRLNGLPVIDDEKCLKCRECVFFCPRGAIEE